MEKNPPMKKSDVISLKGMIDSGNSRMAAAKLREMNERLENYERNLDKLKKRR